MMQQKIQILYKPLKKSKQGSYSVIFDHVEGSSDYKTNFEQSQETWTRKIIVDKYKQTDQISLQKSLSWTYF